DAQRIGGDICHVEEAEHGAQHGEQQRHAGQGEGHGKAAHEQAAGHGEHDEVEMLEDRHAQILSASSPAGGGGGASRPVRRRMLWMMVETPCSATSTAKTRIMVLRRKTAWMPAVSVEPSWMAQEAAT